VTRSVQRLKELDKYSHYENAITLLRDYHNQ